MVKFQPLELKGEYDFGSLVSEYKTEFLIGNAKLKVKSPRGKFELEGPLWELGYDHKGQVAHAKKKWWLTNRLQLIVKQEIQKMNFGVLPSPELQLEHTLRDYGGVDKQKLELKYHTFFKLFTVEEEISSGMFKLKSAINTGSGWKGAGLALKAEPDLKFARDIEIKLRPNKPVILEYKIMPLPGLKVKFFTDSESKKVAAEVEAEFKSEGMKLELKQFVSSKGWSQPLLGISYKF